MKTKATTKRTARRRKAKKETSADRAAREWEKLLGTDRKAALDARIEQTFTGGMLSPIEALYWQTLLQARMTPPPGHLLQAVARSIADGTATLQEIVAERNAVSAEGTRGRAALQRSIVDGLREQTDKARRKLDAVRAMNLTDRDSVWLKLRCEPKGQNREGFTTWHSQADIAAAMGVHKQAVYRTEQRLMKRPEVREYVKTYGESRKPRGPQSKAVTNREKVS